MVSPDVNSRDTAPTARCGRAVSPKLLDELRDELFHKTRTQWARAISGSMAPLILIDDRVLIERVESEQVRFGDVVLFESPDGRVIHRVVGKRWRRGQQVLLEKGDLNPTLGLISTEKVLGRVSAVTRDGTVLDLLSGWGRAVQLGLACCSMGPWLAKWSLLTALDALRLPHPHWRLGRMLDTAVAVLQRTLVRSLGSG